MLEHPLEYALIEFKGNQFSGKIVPELLDLAEREHRTFCGHRLHQQG